MFHDFDSMLDYSKSGREATDAETIEAIIAGCQSVRKTDLELDRAGIDYIATLRNGGEVTIDAKTRTAGCSRYWQEGPELALETWSVMPCASSPGKVGWTLCEQTAVDYILFTFAPQDSDKVFLYPFQLLRVAFRKNVQIWKSIYKVDVQSSGSWDSQCVFVPESIVWTAVRDAMCGTYHEVIAF